MDNIFILNPSAIELDLKDAIDERFLKIKAVTTGILATRDNVSELEQEIVYNLIWLIDDYLDEIDLMHRQLSRQRRNHYN